MHVDKLLHYAKCMGIDFVKYEIDILALEDIIKDPADFYRLSKQVLVDKASCSEGRAIELLRQIEMSKKLPNSDLLTALTDIPVPVSQKLLIAYGDIWNLSTAQLEALVDASQDRGAATRVYDFFADPEMLELMMNLEAAGVGASDGPVMVKDSLKGKSFCFTGALKSMTRNDAWNIVEQAGGAVHEKVKSFTDILVCGDRVGSVKINAARKNGTEIWDETRFLAAAGLPTNVRMRRR